MFLIRFFCFCIAPLLALSACNQTKNATNDDPIVVQDCANTLTVSSGYGDKSIYLLEYLPATNQLTTVFKKHSDGLTQALYLCEQQKIFSTYTFRSDFLGRKDSTGVEIYGKNKSTTHKLLGAINFVANQDEIFIESALLQGTPITPELGELTYDDISLGSTRTKEPPPGANRYDLKYAIYQLASDAQYNYQPIYVWGKKELKQTRTLRKPKTLLCTNSGSLSETGFLTFFYLDRLSLLNNQTGRLDFSADGRFPYLPSTMKNRQAISPDIAAFGAFMYQDRLFLITANAHNSETSTTNKNNTKDSVYMQPSTIYLLNRETKQAKAIKTLHRTDANYVTQYGQFLYILSPNTIERFDMQSKTSDLLPLPSQINAERLNKFPLALVKIKDGFVLFRGDNADIHRSSHVSLDLFDHDFKHLKTSLTINAQFRNATSQYATHPEGYQDCWGMNR
jgi:hypothetical protein